MPCRTLTRALTVLVWALFSTSAALLGMLPVRGWLWRPDPRPWPAALAWGVFLSTSMCITMYGGSQDLRSTTGNSAFKSAMFAYHGVLRMLEGSERCRRRGELCALVQCLRLYCASHPLSPRGWRALLGIALFCTAYGVFNGFTSMWWIQGRTFWRLLRRISSCSRSLDCPCISEQRISDVQMIQCVCPEKKIILFLSISNYLLLILVRASLQRQTL
ncbi:uncharacterized protein LOC113205813 isoform X2 [Frankliniella occidentalis]|uniref:Uncharacterized protein LOC113205813 isoform X2 n=1 Tax=Frankliniella occidentalis TaxID=133901 RepID=A0A9C6XCC9_FRAOC|nr:uncharacterized protein LOC113205813 isoform X2 [Frankliniella occidentalis]